MPRGFPNNYGSFDDGGAGRDQREVVDKYDVPGITAERWLADHEAAWWGKVIDKQRHMHRLMNAGLAQCGVHEDGLPVMAWELGLWFTSSTTAARWLGERGVKVKASNVSAAIYARSAIGFMHWCREEDFDTFRPCGHRTKFVTRSDGEVFASKAEAGKSVGRTGNAVLFSILGVYKRCGDMRIGRYSFRFSTDEEIRQWLRNRYLRNGKNASSNSRLAS